MGEIQLACNAPFPGTEFCFSFVARTESDVLAIFSRSSVDVVYNPIRVADKVADAFHDLRFVCSRTAPQKRCTNFPKKNQSGRNRNGKLILESIRDSETVLFVRFGRSIRACFGDRIDLWLRSRWSVRRRWRRVDAVVGCTALRNYRTVCRPFGVRHDLFVFSWTAVRFDRRSAERGALIPFCSLTGYGDAPLAWFYAFPDDE